MKIEEILEQNKDDISKVIDILSKDTDREDEREIDLWQDQYDGKHVILEKKKKEYTDNDGNTQSQEVIRLIIEYQKLIVEFTTAFLFGEPVKLILHPPEDADENDDATAKAFRKLNQVLKKNKIQYFDRKLSRRLFIETKVAELWHVSINKDDKTQEKKYRVLLLSSENGDQIYAHFNDFGDMDAFSRKYTTEDAEGKKLEHFDIYMADKTLMLTQIEGGWSQESEPNIAGKIPVIYLSQKNPEWLGVQTEIDRSEDLISGHADTNDYFGSPFLKTKGEIEEMPQKGESGKVLSIAEKMGADGKVVYGDADFLTWDNSPESIKLEYDNLQNIIHEITATPNLNFDNLKGLSNPSGIALKLMFFGSILKSLNKQEIFGEGWTRRINLLRAMIGAAETEFTAGMERLNTTPEFGNPLPENTKELIETLTTATAGKAVMTQGTAITQNTLVENPVTEAERLAAEEAAAENLNESLNI